MRRRLCLFLIAVFCSLSYAVQAQIPADSDAGLVAHPHRGLVHIAAAIAPGTTLPPYETPASLACIYRLAQPTVPGCPVLGTTAVPTGGSGVIAIVSAFDNPPALADLNVFSQNFGLPQCNASNACFQTVYATGVRPPEDALWAQGDSIVAEYTHAFAPSAQIVLVEAASSSVGDVYFAVGKANRILANHGGGQMILPFSILETPNETTTDALFTTPGVVYISGNQGSLGLFDYPGSSPNVICLGGTGLVRNTTTGDFEGELASSFWTGGQSVYESRPSYQDAVEDKVGTQRGIPDLAFASDPLTGAALYYSSVNLDGIVGWIYEGTVAIGESAWAGIINRAGSHATNTQAELTLLYSDLGDTTTLRDITKGKGIGKSARPGWDFMTGVGVPVALKGK
jgi:kumamolisin